jgi:hypothetical protein
MKKKRNVTTAWVLCVQVVLMCTCSIVLFTCKFKESQKSITYKLNKKIHDFHEVDVKDSVSADFVLINTGELPIKIKNIEVDCHCTVARAVKTVIQPRDSSDINIVFHPEISGPGYFNRLVYVKFDNGNEAILTIKGNVN